MDKQSKDCNGQGTTDFIGQLTEVERTYFLTFGTLKGYDKKDLKNSWMRYLPEGRRVIGIYETKKVFKGTPVQN